MTRQEARNEEKSLSRPAPGFLASPFSAMRRLSDEMERMFEGGLESRWPRLWSGAEPLGTWSPRVDMFERKGQLVIQADLPGMTKDDVKVEILDGHLQIQGERKTEKEEKDEGHYRSECSYGSFSRVIALPEGIKADEAKATFKNGVLEVTLPAPSGKEKHGRRLEIQS